jgi:hypothetical protein
MAKKVSYTRFSTKPFQNNAQKVSYKWFCTIPFERISEKSIVNMISHKISQYKECSESSETRMKISHFFASGKPTFVKVLQIVEHNSRGKVL